MKIAWLTDLHLNFIRPDADLRRELRLDWNPDAILVGGDTAEAISLSIWLARLADTFKVPVYFVLGNHDYYGSGIEEVRAEATMLDEHNLLHWLPIHGPVQLTESTALVGHGGWGDGRYADFMGSTIVLNDYLKIKELYAESAQGPAKLLAKLKSLGDEAAASLKVSLAYALHGNDRVIVLTHVPPFAEAAWHEGNPSDENWLPHFTCKAVGDTLLELAAANPDKGIQVLCGHSHSAGECWPLPNLRVSAGRAVYGKVSKSVQPPILVP